MKQWRRPRWSIRLRLAALLTALFVLLGGTLLAVSYALVRSNLTNDRGHAEIATDTPLHEAIPPEQRPAVLEQVRATRDELVDDTLSDLTWQYLAIMAAMAVLSSALGWLVAGRVLRPIDEITATARRVSQESLHERIALEGPHDELKRLADTFDAMLARLEAGFDRQAGFVRNASHELRTPLSVIRTEADVALADEADDPDALRRSLTAVREAGERSERTGAIIGEAKSTSASSCESCPRTSTSRTCGSNSPWGGPWCWETGSCCGRWWRTCSTTPSGTTQPTGGSRSGPKRTAREQGWRSRTQER